MQRTEVMPRDHTLAEKEPAKFAALLMERLQKVKTDRDNVEKVMQSINQTKVCSGILCTECGLCKHIACVCTVLYVIYVNRTAL